MPTPVASKLERNFKYESNEKQQPSRLQPLSALNNLVVAVNLNILMTYCSLARTLA